MVKKTRRISERRNSEKSFNGQFKVKLELLNGGDTPHEMMVKVEMDNEEGEEKGQPSMMVHNEAGSFQGTFARCKSQVDAYDAIESKIKEFGGHIGYFNVVRTDLASLEFNTDQMIPVQNW